MEFLSDDPTILVSALGLAALVLLALLKVTQQGKYLIWAGGVLALLVVVLVIERLWVTDAERIEATVYGLAKAVEASDPERAASFLAPECVLEAAADRGDRITRYVTERFAGPVSRERLEATLPRFKFDFVRVSRLTTHAGVMSRQGTAEFVVHVLGMQQEPSLAGVGTPASGMGWSMGLREVAPGDWKVTRITPGMRGGGGED